MPFFPSTFTAAFAAAAAANNNITSLKLSTRKYLELRRRHRRRHRHRRHVPFSLAHYFTSAPHFPLPRPGPTSTTCRVDLLSKLFCSAVYSKSLAALTGDSAVPLAQTLRSQLNILKSRAAALERRGVELRSQLLPAELHEAATQAKSRLRDPCSAGIGAFQAHEGEQDIPRADALQFAREGGLLRRARILVASNTLVHFKVFREYPANAAALPPPESRPAPEPSRQGGGGGGGGGLWVVEVGGKRQTLVGLRADASRRLGLLFSTKEDGVMEVACDDQESYRMWLGVAAAVCPAAAASSIE